MSSAFAARGTQLQRAGVTIAEVTKINKSGSKMDLVDVTNMDSPSFFREFLPTLNDSGELSFDCNFIPGDAAQQALLDDFNNQVKSAYIIPLPSTKGRFSFDGYVTTDDLDLTIDKAATKPGKVKVTGPITFTPDV